VNIFTTTAGLLCVAALLFSFSVAATNVVLALTLILGLLSGLWWQGVRACWKNYKLLTIVICIYLMILMLGLLWSLDFGWGVHVLGRHWFWLLIPVVVAVCADETWRDRFMLSLSTGLGLNLVFCVLQIFGYVEVNTDGSNAMDATGHIGHIGFGFVYGIWAAWLCHRGYYVRSWQRWVCWGLAAWAYVMIFIAQGRAGQLVATVLFVCVLFRMFRSQMSAVRLGILAVVAGVIGLSAVSMFGGDRWQQFMLEMERFTVSEHVSAEQMLSSSTGQRIYMLKVSLNIWRQHPLLGVGTGGFPTAVKQWQQQHGAQPSMMFVHPHNQYMLDVVRWGVVGLLCVLALLMVWVRTGWHLDWRESDVAPLIFMTAIALAIDSMFGPALEEHFSGVLAVLLLGVGLSPVKPNKPKRTLRESSDIV